MNTERDVIKKIRLKWSLLSSHTCQFNTKKPLLFSPQNRSVRHKCVSWTQKIVRSTQTPVQHKKTVSLTHTSQFHTNASIQHTPQFNRRKLSFHHICQLNTKNSQFNKKGQFNTKKPSDIHTRQFYTNASIQQTRQFNTPVSSTKKVSSAQTRQFNTKKPSDIHTRQFHTNASIQQTCQFNTPVSSTKKVSSTQMRQFDKKALFCGKLTSVVIWRYFCVDLTHLRFWTDAFNVLIWRIWGLKRGGPYV